jgi:hypothetical protein
MKVKESPQEKNGDREFLRLKDGDVSKQDLQDLADELGIAVRSTNDRRPRFHRSSS